MLQRRSDETFSPYARQFLDRMDKPQVDAIEGIPPAIAIDQTNPVRTSRSTVGTMTELNDHLKLLFARAGQLFCRGCGRVIGIDYGLIVPDETKTLREGAIRPWQSPSFHDCQDDLEKYAKKRGVPLDVPFRDLSAKHRAWVLEGEPEWVSWRKSWPGTWYGVARFFRWLETKAYKMHVRVLLSRYRAYTPCSACKGARLKPEALLWRVGTKEDADRVLDPARRFIPQGAKFSDEVLRALPGLTVHDLVLLPAERAREFFEHLHLPAPLDEATDLLL